jgi:hypothetical protein
VGWLGDRARCRRRARGLYLGATRRGLPYVQKLNNELEQHRIVRGAEGVFIF